MTRRKAELRDALSGGKLVADEKDAMLAHLQLALDRSLERSLVCCLGSRV